MTFQPCAFSIQCLRARRLYDPRHQPVEGVPICGQSGAQWSVHERCGTFVCLFRRLESATQWSRSLRRRSRCRSSALRRARCSSTRSPNKWTECRAVVNSRSFRCCDRSAIPSTGWRIPVHPADSVCFCSSRLPLIQAAHGQFSVAASLVQ
jgi:hypothetical protein